MASAKFNSIIDLKIKYIKYISLQWHLIIINKWINKSNKIRKSNVKRNVSKA